MRKTVDRTVLLETFEQLGGTTEYEMEISQFPAGKAVSGIAGPYKVSDVGGRGAGKTRVFKTCR